MLKKKRNKFSKLDKIINKKPKPKKIKIPKVKKISFSSTDFLTLALQATKKGKKGKQAKSELKKINQQDYYINLINTFYKNSNENVKRFIRISQNHWENENIIYFLENFYEELNALETSEEVLNYIKNETVLQ